MADYIRPALSQDYWTFPAGSGDASRMLYPTEAWTIPSNNEIVNVYYDFDYSASTGLYYNFPGLGTRVDMYLAKTSSGKWTHAQVGVPQSLWNGTPQTGLTSALRIGFSATKKNSGSTSGTKKMMDNLVLTIEYQPSVDPSTVSIDQVNVGATQTVTLTNPSPAASHRVKWTYGSVESQEFSLNASQRTVSWAVPSASIATVSALAPANSKTITGSVSVTTLAQSPASALVSSALDAYSVAKTRSTVGDVMSSIFGVGNVDLLGRPTTVTEGDMYNAGWTDAEQGSSTMATVFTCAYRAGSEGVSYSRNIVLHMTPITASGNIKSPTALDSYVDSLLTESSDQAILTKDAS